MTQKEIIEGLKKLSASTISDALDSLGAVGDIPGIKRQTGKGKICGAAYTAKYEEYDGHGGLGNFVGEVEPGSVIVIDNAGRTYCSVWGDLTSLYASVRGVEATVIDGIFRDIDDVEKTGYRVYSKGNYMCTGKKRVQCSQVQVPISLSGRTVTPGDIIFGDSDGLLVIPQELAAEVLEIASNREAKDALVSQAVRNGVSLPEAMKKFK